MATVTAKRTPPVKVRHRWKKRKNRRGVYDCKPCGMWTANLLLYKMDVCPAKDRRVRKQDRRKDSWYSKAEE